MSDAFNLFDWYWLADDGRIFASARQSLVPADDATYTTWSEHPSCFPTPWPRDANGAQTDAALQDVLAPYGLFVGLAAYAAAKRYAVETGGISLNGAAIATDRQSQGMIGNAYALMQAAGTSSVEFKTQDGFVTLTAEQFKALAIAVGTHVQACYAKEADVLSGISAKRPTIQTIADVDAAFAGLGLDG